MITDKTKAGIEEARATWSNIAKDNGWYSEPFFVQVWLNKDGSVDDSLAYRDMKKDIILNKTGSKILN